MLALRALDLCKTYGQGRSDQKTYALNNVSFELSPGETLGIVGESGCGKSTLAKALCKIITVDSGTVLLSGEDFRSFRGTRNREYFRRLQMVFQDPLDSFDPRMTLGKGITEVARNFGMTSADADRCMYELLERVGLQAEYAHRYPHQVSGGECQRAAIARALMVKPQVLICDEATSALDVSAQAAVLDLLRSLREETDMAMLFITHDLAVAQILCNRIAVMRAGCFVEQGTADEVINRPQNEYTKMLLDSVLSVGAVAGGGCASVGGAESTPAVCGGKEEA